MNTLEPLLRRVFSFKELGWPEIEEKFTRFLLLATPWFTLYLHRVEAPVKHPHCHDHPWHFWAFIIFGGYWETLSGRTHWRPAGSFFYRPAKTRHNVVTKGVSWSIILTSRKVREWGIITNETAECVP